MIDHNHTSAAPRLQRINPSKVHDPNEIDATLAWPPLDKRLMIDHRLLHMSATNQHPTKRPNAAADARQTTTNQYLVDNSELGSGAIAT
jgi:hypothetical protein